MGIGPVAVVVLLVGWRAVMVDPVQALQVARGGTIHTVLDGEKEETICNHDCLQGCDVVDRRYSRSRHIIPIARALLALRSSEGSSIFRGEQTLCVLCTNMQTKH